MAAVAEVLQSPFLTQGQAVPAFEQAFAKRHQVAHALAVCNATAALHLGCVALGARPGTRVWTSPNSFLASANCALYCGAEIDFVDIDPISRNISIEALAIKLDIAHRAGKLPTIVIPVDFAGLPADLPAIRSLANRYGFRILRDASHATGATEQGFPVGSQHADITVFSFHAVKIITTAEGGMLTTQDATLAQQLELLRSHGMTRNVALLEQTPDGPWYYEQTLLGYNYRMTDIQAALGLSQLQRLDELHAKRVEIAHRYTQSLLNQPLRLPQNTPDRISAWHLYVIELDSQRTSAARRHVFEVMRNSGIGVNVHYIPIHTQPFYRRLGFKIGDFPNAEFYYKHAISIPLFPAMSRHQQDHVIKTLCQTLKESK